MREAVPYRREMPMCEKCQKIDETIDRYRRLAGQVTDQEFIERTQGLIAELQARKSALHPEQQ